MTSNQTSIRRMCAWLRAVAAIFISVVLLIYLASWLAPGHMLPVPPPPAVTAGAAADRAAVPHMHVMRIHLAGVSSSTLAALHTEQRLILASASLPYLLFLVLAFYRLDRLLAAFALGEYFERRTVGHLRAFSGFLLLAKLLALAAMHLRGAMVAHMTDGAQRMTSLNLSNDDIAVLLMCGFSWSRR
jgi:hypothetical protein